MASRTKRRPATAPELSPHPLVWLAGLVARLDSTPPRRSSSRARQRPTATARASNARRGARRRRGRHGRRTSAQRPPGVQAARGLPRRRRRQRRRRSCCSSTQAGRLECSSDRRHPVFTIASRTTTRRFGLRDVRLGQRRRARRCSGDGTESLDRAHPQRRVHARRATSRASSSGGTFSAQRQRPALRGGHARLLHGKSALSGQPARRRYSRRSAGVSCRGWRAPRAAAHLRVAPADAAAEDAHDPVAVERRDHAAGPLRRRRRAERRPCLRAPRARRRVRASQRRTVPSALASARAAPSGVNIAVVTSSRVAAQDRPGGRCVGSQTRAVRSAPAVTIRPSRRSRPC